MLLPVSEAGSFVSTSKSNWLVSAQSPVGRPYDGHTLSSALNQVEVIANRTPKNAYCDQGYRGYRGHGLKDKTNIVICGKIPKRATRAERKWIKRRAAVEPVIGHLKSDNRLSRNYLKGTQGNTANVVLAAAGYNFSKLLIWFIVPGS